MIANNKNNTQNHRSHNQAWVISNKIPLDIGTIHLVGIGGIGMSGIAELLFNLGYNVQGSDKSNNSNIERLKSLGIEIHTGDHQASNIYDEKTEQLKAHLVVISSAVQDDNPEVMMARKMRIPVLRRSEMLAELMRFKTSIAIAGTHGKTTTTTMAASLLAEAGIDPTVINGGIINAFGSNARLGQSDWMVVEADESDGTFIQIPATIAIITNIDPEHLEYYGSFDKLKETFLQFVQNIPFYGLAILCKDHPEVEKLIPQIRDRKIITYGLSPQADICAKNIRTDNNGWTYADITISEHIFDLLSKHSTSEQDNIIKDFALPMAGHHNLSNALAAVTLAITLDIPYEKIKSAMHNFKGVNRRFTLLGQKDGINIIDDYAHHPVEINATLSAARQYISDSSQNKIIAVFQPHRYSRLHDLWDEFATCFNQADLVLVTPIYPAGEAPMPDVTSENIALAIRDFGHKAVELVNDNNDIIDVLKQQASNGDYLVYMGAGDITNWAKNII